MAERSGPLAYAPDDLAFPGLSLDDLCFHFDEGVYGEVRDAAKCTRGQAIAAYVSEVGCHFTEVRCVVRYVLMHTRQDVWDGPGRDRWADDRHYDSLGSVTSSEAWEDAPAAPPSNWRPDEAMPCWSVCRPEHPRAQRAYMLEVKGDNRIPDTPVLAVAP